MTTSIKRIPRERTTVARLTDAYGLLERALVELEAIKLTTLPRSSAIKAPVREARKATTVALKQTGTALRIPPQAFHAATKRAAKQTPTASTSVQAAAS